MFLTRPFVRRYDRVRGTGWLDCPNCHEHTSQDVVDEMTFACLTFYRLTPIRRRRALVCKRCLYRRKAVADETGHLETSGRPVRRAWLFPVGAAPLILIAATVLYVTNHTTEAVSTLTYGNIDLSPITVGQLKLPVDYNRSKDTEISPPTLTALNLAGTLIIRLRRFPISETPAGILHDHFADDQSAFEDSGFPGSISELPTPPKDVSIAGTDGLMVKFSFTHGTEKAEMLIYAFNHNGVSYTFSYEAVGTDALATYGPIEKTITPTLSLEGNRETAGPTVTPSPAPSGSPSPSASASASASAKPSATP